MLFRSRLTELIALGAAPDLGRYAVPDRHMEQQLRERGRSTEAMWLLTFEPLLSDGQFVRSTQHLLKTLEQAYRYPVDIEFTVNSDSGGRQRINLVQCRPLQTRGAERRIDLPDPDEAGGVFFHTHGNFMGGSVNLPIDLLVWVDPQAYMDATNVQRLEVARIVGRLGEAIRQRGPASVLLCGPGRWGTSTPSLGVSVRFAEISHVTALVEIASHEAGIVPELSYGTHFFQDLVENNTFYVALAVEQSGCRLEADYVNELPNVLAELLPEAHDYTHVIKVAQTRERGLTLFSDVVRQEAICCEAAGKPRR